MEVTPELYAWLSSQKVIDPFKSFESELATSDKFYIDERTLELLSGGKYMDTILKSLQDAYNQFYNLSLNYLENINEMKEIDEEEEYISNSIKYTNWHLIQESLSHFGLNYEDEIINKISEGDKKVLIQVLNEIYELHNEVLKHTQLENHSFDPNEFIENNLNEEKIKNYKTLSSISKKSNKNNIESININELNPNKNYELCNTLLEFFIVSFCKNFNLQPRQSVALITNNRKYLSILCNKGTKGSFEEVNNWLNDLDFNIKTLFNLLKLYDDGINISYAIIGTALCSKDENVVLNCCKILNKIQENFNCDWDWLNKEGIDSFIFAILKHENLRLDLINSLFFHIKDNIDDFFNQLRKKLLNNNEKKNIFEFFSSILPILKDVNDYFFQNLQDFLFEICFNESDDISYSSSILGDAFFYFYPLDNNITDKILEYFNNNIRSEKENIFSTAIAQIFSLMERFGEFRIEYAPILYKNMVNLFIENFDNEIKREFILFNFERFLNDHQTVPIDIFIEPYIKKLFNSENYSLCDLLFLIKLIEHPRLNGRMLINIIKFILKITLKNNHFKKLANLILAIIFEKEIINNLCNEVEIIEISKIFSDYISTTLKLFIANIKKEEEDPSILETSYDIINEDFEKVNENVHKNIIESIKTYRKNKKKYSSGLLSLLWVYNDHDDVLLNLEEENRIKYEPIVISLKKEAEKKLKEDNKSPVSKNQKLLNELSEKSKKKKEEEKKKEMKKKLNETTNNNSAGNIINKNLNMNNIFTEASENIKKKKMLINKLTEIDENQKIDDIFIKHGRVIFPEKKIQIKNLENDINKLEKIKSIQQLIYPEGTIIKDSKLVRAKSCYFRNDISDTLSNPIDLQDEENRELKAIDGFNIQYKKNIIFYYRTYFNEKRQAISKTNLLRMFRDRGYNKYRINLDELNLTIKDLLNEYLKEVEIEHYKLSNLDYLNDIDLNIKKKIKLLQNGELDLDFFKKINVKLAHLIYHKTRPTLTISQCYGLFLERLSLAVQSDIIVNLYDKFKPVINLINKKRRLKQKYNLPPGFKIIKKERIEYNKQLPNLIINSIGENKYICYEILNEIIYDIFDSTSIESYVQINNKEDIEIDPLKLHKWSIDLTLSYVNLNDNYKKEGIEVADILEEQLSELCKGKDKEGKKIINSIQKSNYNFVKKILKSDNNKEIDRKKRSDELKLLIEENKKIKAQKKKEEINEQKKIRKEKIKEFEMIKKKFEQIEEKRKKNEEEKVENKKKEKEKELKQKYEEHQKELKEYKEFFHQQNKKLENQFINLKKKRDLLNKQKELQEYNDEKLLEKIKEKKKKKDPKKEKELKDLKEYFEFEKRLNTTIKELIEREDIKNIIEKYKPHLECIYKIYSQIGFKKISFYTNASIRENDFKEFLLNFSVLNLLVSIEQMKWIFKKISNEKLKERENQSFLDFDDFILAITYLSIFSRFTERSRKILPVDIENTNGDTINNFIQFLGLKIPFNKLEVENFINDRRAMDYKKLIKLQKEIKNSELVKEIKNYEVENEEEKEKENDIKQEEQNKEEKIDVNKDLNKDEKTELNNEENKEDNKLEKKDETKEENKEDNKIEKKDETNEEKKDES